MRISICIEVEEMPTQAEVIARLEGLADQLTKATAEIVAAVGSTPNASPELVAAVEKLETLTQALDDLNPDVV